MTDAAKGERRRIQGHRALIGALAVAAAVFSPTADASGFSPEAVPYIALALALTYWGRLFVLLHVGLLLAAGRRGWLGCVMVLGAAVFAADVIGLGVFASSFRYESGFFAMGASALAASFLWSRRER